MDTSQKNEPDQSGGNAPETPGARQDLSFLWPVIDRIRAVEIKFSGDALDPAAPQAASDAAALTMPDFDARLTRLEAEIAAIKEIVQSATVVLSVADSPDASSPVPAESTGYPARSWKGVAFCTGLSVALLLLAHWLIVFVYDLRTIVLLLASILVPLVVAIVFTLRRRIVLKVEIAIALSIGLLAVMGMSYITSVIEKAPLLPQNLREWIETLEYIASVSFAYFTGALMSNAWQNRFDENKARMGQTTLRVAKRLAKATGQALETGTKVGKQVKSIQDLINAAMPVGTAVVSVVTGVSSILK
jgi:hypothetical protein